MKRERYRKINKSVFSFLRQLASWHCSYLLLLSAGRAAIDRCLLAAGPTAANPPQPNDGTNGQTDRRDSFIYPARRTTRAVSISDTGVTGAGGIYPTSPILPSWSAEQANGRHYLTNVKWDNPNTHLRSMASVYREQDPQIGANTQTAYVQGAVTVLGLGR